VGFPDRLIEGERVLHDTHPHWRRLVVPALLLPLVVGLLTYADTAMPAWPDRGWAQLAVAAAAVLVLVRWSLVPFLRWWTTRLLLTDRRIVVQQGILSRTGREVPLHRVNDVSYERTLLERLLGCGTLVVESGGEHGQLVLVDVPQVERVRREVSRLADPAGMRAPAWRGEE
jgi:uncharacterized membrane protein YdbT with pleckstrin-like domain